MHEFRWLERVHLPPNGTLDDGIARANRLEWNITWAGNDATWCVWSGEDLLLRTDSKEVAEAFLYGLGLAYGVLPEVVFQSLERNVNRVIDGKPLES